jgi:hypothetical protein
VGVNGRVGGCADGRVSWRMGMSLGGIVFDPDDLHPMRILYFVIFFTFKK